MYSGTRLFVGNLPLGVNNLDQRLSKEFSHYGEVNAVEIKTKKDMDGNEIGQFAFVILQADTYTVNQCIQEFSEQEWCGTYLNVSIAKESFIEKLKREREDNEVKKNKQEESFDKTHIENINIKIPHKRNMSDYEERKEIYTKPADKTKDIKLKYEFNGNLKTSLSDKPDEVTHQDGGDVKKEPKRPKRPKNRIKNICSTDTTPNHVSSPKEVKQLTAADEKRLKSMQNMRSSYNEKKSLIKMALSNVDKKVNKVIFGEDGQIVNNTSQLSNKNDYSNSVIKRKSIASESDDSKSKKFKAALFDDNEGDSDDMDNFNLDIKECFQGKDGEKLMQLQSRYKSDKRFVLDERFLDDGNEPTREEEDISKDKVRKNHEDEDKNEEAEMDIEGVQDDEKKKEIEILESILGTSVKVSHRIKDNFEGKKMAPIKTMLRYDPTRADHDKFMSKPNENQKKSKKEKKELAAKLAEEEQKPTPIVSQERYYKVNQSLKQVIENEDKQPFSLLSMFGKANTDEDEKIKNTDDTYEITTLVKTEKVKNPLNESNPFKYDSDTDEERNNRTVKPSAGNKEGDSGAEAPAALLVKENFFFIPDDPRLEEGVRFFLDYKPTCEKSREELKNLVKKRIKNNLRNDRSHLTKLQQSGGPKRKTFDNKSRQPRRKMFKRR